MTGSVNFVSALSRILYWDPRRFYIETSKLYSRPSVANSLHTLSGCLPDSTVQSSAWRMKQSKWFACQWDVVDIMFADVFHVFASVDGNSD